MASEMGCGFVVTGHTATDRAETLLVNLVRGAGADGMQASADGAMDDDVQQNLMLTVLTWHPSLQALAWSRPLPLPQGGLPLNPSDSCSSTSSSISNYPVREELSTSGRNAVSLTLVRPLLTVGRHQTLELCQQSGLEIWEDSTNSDNRCGVYGE